MPTNRNGKSPEEAELDAALDKFGLAVTARPEDFEPEGPGFAGRAINEIAPSMVKFGRGFAQPAMSIVNAIMADQSIPGPLDPRQALGLLGIGRDIQSLVQDQEPEAGGRLAGSLAMALLSKRLPGARGFDQGGRTLMTGGRMRPTVTAGALENVGRTPAPAPLTGLRASAVEGDPMAVLREANAPAAEAHAIRTLLGAEDLQVPSPSMFPTRQHVPPGMESVYNAGEGLAAKNASILGQLSRVAGETPGFEAMPMSRTRPQLGGAQAYNPEFPFSAAEFMDDASLMKAVARVSAAKKAKQGGPQLLGPNDPLPEPGSPGRQMQGGTMPRAVQDAEFRMFENARREIAALRARATLADDPATANALLQEAARLETLQHNRARARSVRGRENVIPEAKPKLPK